MLKCYLSSPSDSSHLCVLVQIEWVINYSPSLITLLLPSQAKIIYWPELKALLTAAHLNHNDLLAVWYWYLLPRRRSSEASLLSLNIFRLEIILSWASFLAKLMDHWISNRPQIKVPQLIHSFSVSRGKFINYIKITLLLHVLPIKSEFLLIWSKNRLLTHINPCPVLSHHLLLLLHLIQVVSPTSQKFQSHLANDSLIHVTSLSSRSSLSIGESHAHYLTFPL